MEAELQERYKRIAIALCMKPGKKPLQLERATVGDPVWWLVGCIDGDVPLPETGAATSEEEVVAIVEGWLPQRMFKFARHEDCPDRGRLHTPVPEGYIERSEDAERRLAKGQSQHRCPTCGFWATWRNRTGRRAPGSS